MIDDPAFAGLRRPTREEAQRCLFDDVEPDWKELWWGMPEFSMADATPQHRITINFMTQEDVRDFCERLGVKRTLNMDSLWWPPQSRLGSKEFVWVGTPSPTRFPIYIPSKGRADCETTGALLRQAGADFWFVVEPPEAQAYERKYPGRVLVLPFHDLGQGSIPARNWIWDHAAAAGTPWHWIIDDNVLGFWRCHGNRRLVVQQSSAPLLMVEDFAVRFDNLAFAGLSADGFCPDRCEIAPYLLNTRVYSVTLINTSLPHRWRGRYNEDTDICLRALKDGWSTVLFRSMLMKKAHTSRGAGETGMKGGNTDTVYAEGDARRAFADSLKEQHPDVVEVVWKFGRWHHEVNYAPFKRNRPRLRAGVTPTKAVNDYGMRLVRCKDEVEVVR
ncbi:MAG: hypothetical protein PHU75_09385 [Candidatus Nanopelagicales bacterium]|nr:hypothetical protein [Candidatus Nanopelagicales bacterium]